MYVKRNYEKSFFREKKKPPPIGRYLILLAVMTAATIWFFMSETEGQVLDNPEMAVTVVAAFFAPEMSPTPQPSQLAQQAQDLYWAGDLDDAIMLLERAIGMRPDSVDYLYEYGMLLLDTDEASNNHAEQAEDIASEIIDLNPNDPRGYALRARSLVWQGQFGSAIPVASAGIDISPNFSPLHAALSRALIGEGRLREGQEAGVQATELAPGNVRGYWAYASSLMLSGARDEAILEYERTIQVHPAFLPPFFELANLYLGTGRDQEAIDVYNQILGRQPRNGQAMLRLCQAYRKVGQFERALGLCRDSILYIPESVAARYQLGVLLYNELDFAGAQDNFRACLDVDENNLACNYRMGLTYYYLARDEYNLNCAGARLTSLECDAPDICATGWEILQQSLIMAQLRSNTEADIDIIREGLSAISTDPACFGVSGRPTPTPMIPTVTPTPEPTPEG